MRAHEQTIYGNTQHTTHWKTITLLYPLTHMDDEDRISPHNSHTTLNAQVMRIRTNVN